MSIFIESGTCKETTVFNGVIRCTYLDNTKKETARAAAPFDYL